MGVRILMLGLSSRIFAVMLATMVAWSIGVCPCAKAQCTATVQPVATQAHSCYHKSTEPSPRQSDGSGSTPHHRCANCVASSIANRPSLDDHMIGVSLAPSLLPPVPLPVIAPSTATPSLISSAGILIPPLLQDLFHTSCLLTV